MIVQRASVYSVGKAGAVGALYSVGFVGLATGALFLLLTYLPFQLAMKVLGSMTPAALDAIRGIGVVSYFGLFTLFALVMGASTSAIGYFVQRRLTIPRGRVFNIALLAAVLALYASSALIAPAFASSISATQTAEYNQFNTKPCSYYVFPDVTNYYAQNCDTGAIAYGGPSNAGGASGSNFTAVFDPAAAQGGNLVIGLGNYTYSKTLTLSTTKNLLVQGAQYAGYYPRTNLKYSGSGWAVSGSGSSWTNGVEVGFQNLQVTNTGSTYTGGIYCNYVACYFLGYVNVVANTAYTGSIGVELTPVSGPSGVPAGNLLASTNYYTCVIDNQDHFNVQHLEISNCYTYYFQIGANDQYPVGVNVDYYHTWSSSSTYAGAPIYNNATDAYIGTTHWESYNESIVSRFPTSQSSKAVTLTIGQISLGKYSVPFQLEGLWYRVNILSVAGGTSPAQGRFSLAWTSKAVGFVGGTGIAYPHTSGTTYVIYAVWTSFACSGGGTVGVTIYDPFGNTILGPVTCANLPTTFWPQNYQIKITNTSAITMTPSFQ